MRDGESGTPRERVKLAEQQAGWDFVVRRLVAIRSRLRTVQDATPASRARIGELEGHLADLDSVTSLDELSAWHTRTQTTWE